MATLFTRDDLARSWVIGLANYWGDSLAKENLSRYVGEYVTVVPAHLQNRIAEVYEGRVVRFKSEAELRSGLSVGNSAAVSIGPSSYFVGNGYITSVDPGGAIGQQVILTDGNIIHDEKGGNKMNTFSFTVNGKSYSIQDELQFIGLARVREVAQVFDGTKLFVKGEKAGELRRVRVGHYFLFPSLAAGPYQFYTKGA